MQGNWMTTILLILQTFFHQILIGYAANSDLTSVLEMKQTELSCQLKNQTVRSQYYDSVRQNYGLLGDRQSIAYDRYSLLRVGRAGAVRCFGACPRATPNNVTWCVHLYHPNEEVKVCLNTKGLLHQTPLASRLQLGGLFDIRKECGATSSEAGCLWVRNTPIYLDRAYFVCTSRTEDCTTTTFISNNVDPSVNNVTITDVSLLPKYPGLGQSAVLKCNATSRSVLGFIKWTHKNETFYPIYEDPFCNSTISDCYRDTAPGAGIAKLQRIRMYTVQQSYDFCGSVLTNMVSYLVIDNITQEDSGGYMCSAETRLTADGALASASFELKIVSSQKINIQPFVSKQRYLRRSIEEAPSQSLEKFSTVPILIIVLLLAIVLVVAAGSYVFISYREVIHMKYLSRESV